MYCPKCGAVNDDASLVCRSCGQAMPRPQTAAGPRPSVPNYLVHAILATIFCCLPFGIVGIVYAAQVDSKLSAGDYAGAQAYSRSARNWTLAAFLCGLAGLVLWGLVVVVTLILETS